MIVAILLGLCIILLVATLLPFIPVAHGAVKVCDFPRQQILVIAAGGLVLSPLAGPLGETWPLFAGFAAVLAVQAAFMLPFTPLWRAQSRSADGKSRSGVAVRLLTANVKQSNREYAHLKQLIRETAPDLLLLLETDQAWIAALEEELKDFRTVIREPRDNSYGMLLASAYRLQDVEVRDLLTPGVPSITCTVCPDRKWKFRFYCVHPEPPVPYADSVGRDAELAIAAKLVCKERLPVIVAGDLNDVGWSRTTRRFQRVSGLLDPRIGRGFFNTFDARYPLLRWPLDHLFHSAHFQVVSMRRLPHIGSDHFPMFFHLALTPGTDGEETVEEARPGDKERGDELIEQARRRDDGPIGADWEK